MGSHGTRVLTMADAGVDPDLRKTWDDHERKTINWPGHLGAEGGILINPHVQNSNK